MPREVVSRDETVKKMKHSLPRRIGGASEVGR